MSNRLVTVMNCERNEFLYERTDFVEQEEYRVSF